MEITNIYLHKASDAEESYALSLHENPQGHWLAERGYGSTFQQIWSVEVQGSQKPDLPHVDWDAVLERVVEAYDLNDPVITDFEWPLRAVG